MDSVAFCVVQQTSHSEALILKGNLLLGRFRFTGVGHGGRGGGDGLGACRGGGGGG